MKSLLVLLLLHYAHSRPSFDNPQPNTKNCIKMTSSKENEINIILTKLSDFINKIIDEHEKINIPYINISIESFNGDENDETETNLQVYVNDCDDIDDEIKGNNFTKPIYHGLTGKTDVGPKKQTIGANKTPEFNDKAFKNISRNEISSENIDKDIMYNKLWKVRFMKDIEKLLDDTVSDIRFIGYDENNEQKFEKSLKASNATTSNNLQELNKANSTADDKDKNTKRNLSNDIKDKFKKSDYSTDNEEDEEIYVRKQKNVKIVNEIDEIDEYFKTVKTNIHRNIDDDNDSNSDDDDYDCIPDEDETDAFKETDDNDQTELTNLNNTTIIVDTNPVENIDPDLSKDDSYKGSLDEDCSDELEDDKNFESDDNIADLIVNNTQISGVIEQQNDKDVFNVTKSQNNSSTYLIETSTNNYKNIDEINQITEHKDVRQLKRNITIKKSEEDDESVNFLDDTEGQNVAEVMTFTLEENGEEMLRMIEKKRNRSMPLLVYVQETKGREEYVFLNKK